MPDNIYPLILFAFVGSFTPGPNTMMVTASGTAFGLRRSWPHIWGVTLGFSGMIAAFGLGLGQLFHAYPTAHWYLRIIGSAYLLYLAWRLALAGDPASSTDAKKPLTSLEAAAFQWLNPKAYTLAIGVITAFTTTQGNPLYELTWIAGVFGIVTWFSLIFWCLFGVGIRRLLSTPRAIRTANITLAVLLALSVITLFL
ncbi:cysteine/O-acetylserine efflux protein [Variibacter gotjawalensis]|uniref:Cysteine/O-acetylserine efflux protein n=1 Tax=Variibacter gotjawalensis TaxID=1333996 RepID=A0A0S3PUV3_9BRAD|nr:LysE family translocator [Variibacter gotjawalensis]NIK50030.1 threonine/homoserine/homoserine lactone efflux protein [Variibacter gotjawalensis]RZS46029.1 threonine/homoserine/homoserine lactone efflux protein [Variibacter gotjawalensis]BAT59704.1 cysteine/O-acetylserine efflux protein [Variibacter gotjawalensis]